MKNVVQKATYVICLCAFSLVGFGQGMRLSKDDLGVNYAGKNYNNIEGTPYSHENWLKGNVALVNGQVYKDLSLKYDQASDILIFLNEEGQAQTFMHPVKEFTLRETLNSGTEAIHTYRSGFSPAEGNTISSFYEVLTEAPIALLKRETKSITQAEERSPNSIVLKRSTSSGPIPPTTFLMGRAWLK